MVRNYLPKFRNFHWMGLPPPNDYKKWSELVFKWVKHSISRYGQKEVESWYWELWNEPNISYWKGTTEEYIKLYDYTAGAVKRALPTAKIGEPEVTGPGSADSQKFFRALMDHIVSGKNAVTCKVGAPYHDDNLPAPDAPVSVRIKNVPGQKVLLQHYRIDKQFGNSYEVWKRMGSPKTPTAEQIAKLERAGQLQLFTSPEWMVVKNGTVQFPLTLPRQGVSLLRLS